MTPFTADAVERMNLQRTVQGLLRDLRHERGWTQQQFAARMSVPQQFVSRYETGERRVDILELLYICDALGITLAAFESLLRQRLPDMPRLANPDD